MKYLFISLFFFCFCASVHGQSPEIKAKAFYVQAEKSFEEKDYQDCLNYLEKVKNELGETNARILWLKVKSEFALNRIDDAQKSLEDFFKYPSAPALEKEMLLYVVDIDDKLEAKRKREEAKRQKLLEEKKRAEAARKIREAKIKALSNKLENEISSNLSQLDDLEEGRAYRVTYRKSLSSGGNDQSIFIYYDNRFIIYTVPNLGLVGRLFKDRVSITSNMVSGRNVAEVKSKNGYGNKVNIRFQAGTHYSNVFLGGFGDDLLWTSGEQNTIFEQFVYYYYELSGATPVLKADIEMKKDFSTNVLNPYIETGTIERTVDYELIKNPELQIQLKENNFDNLPSTNLNEPNSVKVTLETKDKGLTILYPTKNITYALHEKVKGEYTFNNSNFKGQFLHFLPQKIDTHYGFMRIGRHFPSNDLFTAISFTPVSTYKMSKSIFDSIYKSINNPELEIGKTRYFTSTDYKTILEEIPKILSK